ncbi:hypothetical protein K2173_018899 [Erythroxylum novogranatense]|uniref:E3 ubiquitin-protein ligase RMA n=1 Tax=Erythroxylum novogranatense TaxID=1862640 RepID=A0AAV8SB15_9ROSI|nr:hypothetical protein K2173_018899 [Erythroxylum novogranatense]
MLSFLLSSASSLSLSILISFPFSHSLPPASDSSINFTIKTPDFWSINTASGAGRTTAIQQYIETTLHEHELEDKVSPEMWNSSSQSLGHSNKSSSNGFDCNICLDWVQDPVVTLCGHLYCWSCIYKWLHFHTSSSTQNLDNYKRQQQCPVCKAEISQASLVPIFGRGQTTKPSKNTTPDLGLVIPRRPLGPVSQLNVPRLPSSGTISPNLTHQTRHYHSSAGSYRGSSEVGSDMLSPSIGMLREMLYSRVFCNSATNLYVSTNSSPLAQETSRTRRLLQQADRSLSRISFFLFCCAFLCLLLF